MKLDILKNENNEYVITDCNGQVRVATFENMHLSDYNIMIILLKERELKALERKICELEKKLSDSLNNSRLFKKIKTDMNLLIRKCELIEQDLYLIKEEFGYADYVVTDSNENSLRR